MNIGYSRAYYGALDAYVSIVSGLVRPHEQATYALNIEQHPSQRYPAELLDWYKYECWSMLEYVRVDAR